jgi:hypothetical protein
MRVTLAIVDMQDNCVRERSGVIVYPELLPEPLRERALLKKA